VDLVAFQELVSMLGNYKIKRDEYIFSVCPFCKNSKSNFEINSRKGVYSCWVCGEGGHISFLYKKYGIVSDEHFVSSDKEEKKKTGLELPSDLRIALPEICGDDRPWAYLKSRKLSREDVFGYKIMWWGQEGRIVIPFFDVAGSMIFWTARTIFKGVTRKYVHAQVPKDQLVMRWYAPGDIILVEGVFDGFVAHRAGYETIVLMGTNAGTGVIEYLKNTSKKIIVCLDSDALIKQQSVVSRLRKALGDRVDSMTPNGKDLGSQQDMSGRSGFAGNVAALLGGVQ